jgi:hypothetical protein
MLREEQRLRVFENMVLRKIFGPKRDEVTGEWRRCTVRSFMVLHITKYYMGDKVKKNEMDGACDVYREE